MFASNMLEANCSMRYARFRIYAPPLMTDEVEVKAKKGKSASKIRADKPEKARR